jgi:hypothetical protein
LHSANSWPAFLAKLAFSALGFVTGDIMGNSRDSAVGDVLPAVLTLVAGVSIYVIGTKGVASQTRPVWWKRFAHPYFCGDQISKRETGFVMMGLGVRISASAMGIRVFCRSGAVYAKESSVEMLRVLKGSLGYAF